MKAAAFVIIPIYQTRSHLSLILLVHNELACFNTYSSRILTFINDQGPGLFPPRPRPARILDLLNERFYGLFT